MEHLVIELLAASPALLLLAAMLRADKGDKQDEGEDETAKTIIAMPVWMIEELAKKAKEKQDQGEPVSRTMAFDPAQAAKFREAIKNAGAGPMPSSVADESPTTDESAREEGSRTLMFSPQEGEALKKAAEKVRGQVSPMVPGGEEDEGSAHTVTYSKEDMAKLGEGGEAYAATQIFEKITGPAEAATQIFEKITGPAEVGTVAYTPDQREKLLEEHARGGVAGALKRAEVPGGTAGGTEALRRAEVPGGTEALKRAEVRGGTAGGTGTLKRADAPGAAQAGAGEDEVDTGGATAVYSAEESRQFREAYDLLRAKPEEPAAAKVGADMLRQAATPGVVSAETLGPDALPPDVIADKMAGIKAEASRKAATGETTWEETTSDTVGQSALAKSEARDSSNVAILLVLLVLAAAAGAVILHLLGVITLPFDLPKLK